MMLLSFYFTFILKILYTGNIIYIKDRVPDISVMRSHSRIMKKYYAYASFFVGLALLIVPFAVTYADNTVSVGTLSPGSSVAVGKALTFTMSSNGFTNPSYGIIDSMSNSTISASNISGGTFNWTPSTSDLGSHELTIIVSDSSGGNGSATTKVTITVTPSYYATIEALTPGNSVSTNQAVTFTVTPTGFSSPIFYVNDTHGTSTISNANIDVEGKVKWTPTSQDLGEHVISISVVDSSGRGTIVKQTLTVTSGTTPTPTPTATPTVTVTPTPTPSATPTPTPVVTTPIKIYPTQFSPSSVALKLNQASTVTLSGGLASAYAINYNSNASVVLASITGNKLNLSGLNTGGAVIVVCSALNDCGAIQVAVNTTNSITVAAAPAPASVAKSALTANIGSATSSKIASTLKVGMTSPEVSQLQKKLAALSFYAGPVTGYFGTLTETAVKDYQSSLNLEPVGYVGPATRAALNK